MYGELEGVGNPNSGTIGHLGFNAAMLTPRGGKQAGLQACLREASGWTPLRHVSDELLLSSMKGNVSTYINN